MQQVAHASRWPHDRLLILRGPILARTAAVGMVLKATADESEGTCALRLLVPASQASSVTSRQGSVLGCVRDKFGVSAVLEPEEINGARLVTAAGSHSQVFAAA